MARPIQFDRETVLDSAMHTFWENGYAGTSIAALLEATGLKPGSLYAAFNSKEALFMASLDNYAQQSVKRTRRALNASESPLSDLRNYLYGLADKVASTSRTGHSCLLVNTALELSTHNRPVRDRVNRHLGRMEALFRDSLERARDCGELSRDKNPDALAAYIMTTIWGLRVLGGTSSDPGRAKAVVRQLVDLLEN